MYGRGLSSAVLDGHAQTKNCCGSVARDTGKHIFPTQVCLLQIYFEFGNPLSSPSPTPRQCGRTAKELALLPAIHSQTRGTDPIVWICHAASNIGKPGFPQAGRKSWEIGHLFDTNAAPRPRMLGRSAQMWCARTPALANAVSCKMHIQGQLRLGVCTWYRSADQGVLHRTAVLLLTDHGLCVLPNCLLCNPELFYSSLDWAPFVNRRWSSDSNNTLRRQVMELWGYHLHSFRSRALEVGAIRSESNSCEKPLTAICVW